MPSHQIRVQQANCDHDWQVHPNLAVYCTKCGASKRSDHQAKGP